MDSRQQDVDLLHVYVTFEYLPTYLTISRVLETSRNININKVLPVIELVSVGYLADVKASRNTV